LSTLKQLSLLLISASLLTPSLCLAQEDQSDMKPSDSINTMPNIIPAPRKWIGAKGTFDIGGASLTVPHKQLSQLKPVLDMFRQDLVSIGAVETKPAIATHNSQDGSMILFEIKPAEGNPEQYTITISPKGIVASAPTVTGIFYASQSLLQMAMQAKSIPCGTIEDYPSYRVRSLMLDVGRKFFPYETLKDYIRVLGFLKMNELHLHLSDNSFGNEIYPGFRIECETMPELTNKDGFYTKTQIRELQDFAKLRGITITPEIDAPGHAFCFTELRPDLRHPKLGDAYLDVLNPGTLELMKKVFDEFIPLFDAPDVHIGTDEYRRGRATKEEWAELGEGFRKYINNMNRYITEKYGKNVRIWSGWEHMPGTTQPDTNVIIDMWVSSDAKAKSALGYKYINSNHGRTYIVPGAGYYGVSNNGLYGNWTPAVFTGKKEKDPKPNDPNLLGGKLHIWNDMGPNGYTMYEIADLAVPTIYVMSEKMWGTKASKDYAAFKHRAEKLANIPDTALLERHIKSTNDAEAPVFDSGDKVYTLETSDSSIMLMPYLGGADDEQQNLEFPWTISMQIKPNGQQAAPAAIISSRIAELQADLQFTTSKRNRKTKVTTTTEHNGLGFSRLDKYSSHPLRGDCKTTRAASGIKLPSDKFSNLTYVGNRRNTKIYLDGKQIASFSGSRQQTLCPLEYVGTYPGRKGGFVGEIKSIKIYNRALDKAEIARLAGFELPVNIAKGSKATASKSDTGYGLTPEKLTDGNTSGRSSRWSSGGTREPAEVTLDLGTTRTITGINLYWEAAYPKTYTVVVSEDGKNFSQFAAAKGAPKLIKHTAAPVKGRFIRVKMKDPATQWGYSLYEIEVFGK